MTAADSNNARSGERGNAFLYILIGVVLFAALAYTFTRSARQGGENIGTKKIELAATEIIGYGQRLQTAVSQLLLKGCSESQLDFGNNIFKLVDGTDAQPPGHNPGATANCAVFGPGTGIAPEIASPAGQTTNTTGWLAGWPRAGHGTAYEGIVSGLGTGSTDLVYRISGMKRDVCVRINEKLGVTNTGGEPPVDDDGFGAFDGAFDITGVIGNDDANLAGKRSFCYQNASTPPFYSFVTTLIER